jgi:hypothetical protein
MVNFVWYKINFLSELRLLSTLLHQLYDYTIIQSQEAQLISVGLKPIFSFSLAIISIQDVQSENCAF